MPVEARVLDTKKSYLSQNQDFLEFVKFISDSTCENLNTVWLEQAKQNQEYIDRFKKDAVRECVGKGDGKVAIIIGASPAIKQNYESLYEIVNDDHFVLIAVNSIIRFLLEKKIEPDYVMVCDALEEVSKNFEGLEIPGRTILISNQYVHPKTLETWKGKVSFVRMGTDKKTDPELEKIHPWLTFMYSAGNVFNFGVNFAYGVLGSRALVFCGNELSYRDQYYADRPSDHDKNMRWEAMDIRGGSSYTTPVLYQYKLWLEDFCSKAPGIFINATEDGILGVTPRYGRLPFIFQLTLKSAIEKCKSSNDVYNRALGDWKTYMEVCYDSLYIRPDYNSKKACIGMIYVNRVKQYFPKANSILDVGCGAGHSLRWFDKKGYKTWGTEISGICINDLCEDLKGKIIKSFAHELPFPDSKFDLVYCTDVLEHIPLDHVDQSINEIYRVSNNAFITVNANPSTFRGLNGEDLHLTRMNYEEWAKKLNREDRELIPHYLGKHVFLSKRKCN